MKSGRLNLAVLFDDGQLGGFEFTPLVEEDLMYICRASSNWVPQASPVTLGTALASPLILPAQQHGVRPLIEQVAAGAGLALANIIEINSIAILKSALLADMGATLLPLAPLRAEIESGALVATPLDSPAIRRRVTLYAFRNIPLTNAATAISRLVRQVTEMLCTSEQWPGARLRE
ncbi:MAG: LysR family transcriptional regulator, nitrogen assimilation regulatory protein [Massilia sp.]